MAVVSHVFPAPPVMVWQSLPAGTQALNAEFSRYDQHAGTLWISTGITWLTFGQNIWVQLEPVPEGTRLTLRTTLKFGLVDWGEGTSLCHRFLGAVDGYLRQAPPQYY